MQRWIVMVGLGVAACDSGEKKAFSRRPPPPVAPGDANPVAAVDAFDEDVFIPSRYPKETLGWLKGTVTDAQTHEPVAAVSLKPPPDEDGWWPTGFSHEDGRYRLRYPEGTYSIGVSYYGNDLFQRDVTIKRGDTTTLDFTVEHALVVRALAELAEWERERAPPTCPPRKDNEELATGADLPAVAGAVLRYYTVHPKEMMDWSTRLPRRGHVFVVDEVTVDGAIQHLDTKSLQAFAPKRFVIKTKAEIQAESDKRDGTVDYLYFKSVDFKSTCATVDFGITMTIPTHRMDGQAMDCCSSGVDLFHKGKPWTKAGRSSSTAY